MTRLFRSGVYPPLRGTALRLDEEQTIFYTRGSVHFSAPIRHVRPNPLVLYANPREGRHLLIKEDGCASENEVERHAIGQRVANHAEGSPPGRGYPSEVT